MRRVLVVGVVVVLVALCFLRWNRSRFSAPQQLKPGVFEVRQSFVSTYGIRTAGGIVLIDAGMDPGGAAIDALLKAMHAERHDVRAILLTHGHWDHTAAVPLFPGADVYGGEADVGLAAGTEKPRTLVARIVVPFMQPPPVTITRPLEADTSLGSYAKAYPLAGHTQGSMAYLVSGILFVGDAIKVNNGILMSWPDSLHADAQGNKRSIWALQQRLGVDNLDRVCGGHNGCTPAGMGSAALNSFTP